MESTSNPAEASQNEDSIIAPRELCQSCHAASGPKFSVSAMRDSAAIVRTTAPLTDQQRISAEANIAWAQSEGVSLDEEIVRVQHSLEKLQKRRDAVRRFEQDEMGLLNSPIRRLPVEILRQIFLLAHGGALIRPHDPNVFPRVAARVCSHWRSVSHSCAPLWANVMVMPSHGPMDKCNAKDGESLEDCVRFSDGMPFYFCLSSPLTAVILGEGCIQALAQIAYRWHDVYIGEGELTKSIFDHIAADTSFDHLDSLDLLKLKDALHINSTPKLNHLTVSDSNGTNAHITIGSAPFLFHIRLQRVSHPSALFTGIKWSQITKLESLGVLESMSNLASFALSGPTRTSRSVTLQRLEMLNLGGINGSNALEVLTTPNLKKLYVGWGFESDAVAQFVRRCGCKLEVLKLTSTTISASWASTDSASVKELIWEDPFSVGQVIPHLTLSSTAAPGELFPALEKIHIVDLFAPGKDETDDWNFILLFDMVRSRLQLPQGENSRRGCLKSLQIKFESILEDAEGAVLREFIQSEALRIAGLKVRIVDGDNVHITTESV